MAHEEMSPEQIQAWLQSGHDKDREEEQARQALALQQAAAEKARHQSIWSGRPKQEQPAPFKKAKRSLAEYVRDQTDGNREQADFFRKVANGEIDGVSVKDRMEAHRWLADRGSGRAVETVVSVESEENPLADLSVEELRALARKK